MRASIVATLTISGAIAFAGAASAFNPLESLGEALQNAVEQQPERRALEQQPASRREAQLRAQAQLQSSDLGAARTGERQVVYEGYSKEMLPLKQLLAEGRAKEALQQKTSAGSKTDDLDMLGHLEIATLAMDAAVLDQSKEGFQRAEMFLNEKDDRSIVGGFFSGATGSVLSTLTGNAELGEYPGAGYERVLMLNYKSIAHLLDGERSAYNVTRRAIDLQNIEKQKFDELVREAKAKIKEEEANQKEKGADVASFGLSAVIEEQYQSTDKMALTVPHAFVNPFGFYIAGVVQELDSYEDSSLRDNARISYKKALELNPKSKVIEQAAADMSKPAKKGRRLVNVIIADGFAPEMKLLKFDLSLGKSQPTIIELPLYEPVKSRVARVEVQTTSGKRWARASEVADISALALRFQKDAGPIQQLRMMTTVVRNMLEGGIWSQAEQQGGILSSTFGKLKKKRDELAHPDMRSWTTLPSRLLAARFFVPKTVSRIKIVAFDAKGRSLASKVVDIDKESHNVVYARVIDKTIYPSASKKMWVGL